MHDHQLQAYNEFGENRVQFGKEEIRLQKEYPEPFPLFPYEELSKKPTTFKTILQNSALLLQAIQPFTSSDGVDRFIEDQYLIKGPATYIPRIEEIIVKEIKATVIKPNQSILLRSKKDLTD